MSTAIDASPRQALCAEGLPFDVKADAPNEAALTAFHEVDAILTDPFTRGYTGIEELEEALEA